MDLPPFQLQQLIPSIFDAGSTVRCSQALGSEIYVGTSNGELLRYGIQADDPQAIQSYSIISRQTLPGNKPIDELVLLPSIERLLVQSDHQLYIFMLPSLDPCPIKPIRHVVTFAVDDHHLRRPPAHSFAAAGITLPVDPVEFSIVKRTAIAMYVLTDRLHYVKEIPLPQGALLARRAGKTMCIADKEVYNMLDLEKASMMPVIPICQGEASSLVKPSITVIGPAEFLVFSWTGAGSFGLFLSSEGDPVRGTLEWSFQPDAVALDYPYLTALAGGGTIEIHNIEKVERGEPSLIQTILAPPSSPVSPTPRSPPPGSGPYHRRSASATTQNSATARNQRTNISSSIGGFMVPTTQGSDKMKPVPVKLLRT